MSVKTLEELQAEFADAQLKFERTHAALQGLGPDSDKQTREDLDSEFSADEAQVKKIADDIGRIERMNEAVKAAPRTDIKVGSEPKTYEKGARNDDGTFRSFFRDLFRAGEGDVASQTRIARHSREIAVEEQRAAITTGSGGVGLR